MNFTFKNPQNNPHNDPKDIPKIIAFESVYSMDGDIAPIEQIAEIAKNYNALMDWKEANPDFMNNEDKTDYFTKTVSTLGKLDTNIDSKIIKNICKETYVKEKDAQKHVNVDK